MYNCTTAGFFQVDVHDSLVPTFVADDEAQSFCDAMNW
jgi:hypothetical protein